MIYGILEAATPPTTGQSGRRLTHHSTQDERRASREGYPQTRSLALMGGPGSGSKPREYPPEIINLACEMYRAGMTVAEIRAVFPRGYRVQTILERHLPSRRPKAPRDQSGPANALWRGGECGYAAAHLRVYAVKGRARTHTCIDCGAPAQEWSYIGGCPGELVAPNGCRYSPNPDMYEPRCRPCHQQFDGRAQRANGQWAGREEVMPHV